MLCIFDVELVNINFILVSKYIAVIIGDRGVYLTFNVNYFENLF